MKFFRRWEQDEFAEPDRPRRKKTNLFLTLVIDAVVVAALLAILMYATYNKRQDEKARVIHSGENAPAEKSSAPKDDVKAPGLPTKKAAEETKTAGPEHGKKAEPAKAQDKVEQPSVHPPEKSQPQAPPPKETIAGDRPDQEGEKALSYTDDEMVLQRRKTEGAAKKQSEAKEKEVPEAPAKNASSGQAIAPVPEEPKSAPSPDHTTAKPMVEKSAHVQAPPPPVAKPSKPETAAAPSASQSAPAPEKTAPVPSGEKKSLVILSSGGTKQNEPRRNLEANGAEVAPPVAPEKKSVVIFSARGEGKPAGADDAKTSQDPKEKSTSEQRKQIVILSSKPGESALAKPMEKPSPATQGAPFQELAAPANPPTATEGKSLHRKGYRLRFALCRARESCEQIRSTLSEAGITVALEKARQDFQTYHAALGPWHTPAHSRQAAAELNKIGIKTTTLVSADKYYLITEPEMSERAAKDTLKKAREAGMDGKTFDRMDSLEVFVVYGESFDKPNVARQRMAHYRKLGFDCIVEE